MKLLTIGNFNSAGLLVAPSGESPDMHSETKIGQRLAAEEVVAWLFENMPDAFLEKLGREVIRRRIETDINLNIALAANPDTRYLVQE